MIQLNHKYSSMDMLFLLWRLLHPYNFEGVTHHYEIMISQPDLIDNQSQPKPCVECCCRLNDIRVCDEHLFGQVSRCTGRSTTYTIHFTNKLHNLQTTLLILSTLQMLLPFNWISKRLKGNQRCCTSNESFIKVIKFWASTDWTIPCKPMLLWRQDACR